MTRFSIVLAAIAACVPPTSSTGTAPASSGSTAAQGGTCDGACARLAACELVTDTQACMQECHGGGYTPDALTQLEHGQCAEISAWMAQSSTAQGGGGDSSGGEWSGGDSSGGGYSGNGRSSLTSTDGLSCTGGDGRCTGLTVCCGNNGPAEHGTGGVCQRVAICNMPKR